MITRMLILALGCLGVSAEPEALRALEIAADSATDPGLVAFNRGVALARLERFAEAEAMFQRCLDDAAIPTERRAKALYNRGVCLLARDDLAAVRRAIDAFAACRDDATDATLLADAMHNLELAKLRWQHLRAKQPQPPTPKEDTPGGSPAKSSEAVGGESNSTQSAGETTTPKPKPGTASATNKTAPGAGTLPVLLDDAVLSPLSPAETQAYLERVAERLAKQRRSVEALRAGPDRPKVRNW